MENKQTAVEWAEDKLSDLNSAVVNGEIAPEEYHEIRVNIWKKAKAMEKEQIMKAYKHGEVGEIYELNPIKTLTAKQYYENNYEKTN